MKAEPGNIDFSEERCFRNLHRVGFSRFCLYGIQLEARKGVLNYNLEFKGGTPTNGAFDQEYSLEG